MLSEVMEPHLFVMGKQRRESPERVTSFAHLLRLGWLHLPGSSRLYCLCCSSWAGFVITYPKLLLLLQLPSWRRLVMVMDGL
ncbi:unnamed protein product [Linum tenue]|uniref:Uncharacterized protein n=1 Tax=Linum tenue TaxID=586396 RepID=A0AAV0RXX1_9ROSI|nr:unnamed protein product [Linum tenue]